MSGQTIKSPKLLQPIDRLALGAILILGVLIGLLLLNGDRTAPRVRDFSWQDRQISADDTAFILTFSRPMNQASVEKNLKLVARLPDSKAGKVDDLKIEGKISWAGRKMAYTLLSPLPYGTEYKLELQGATDRLLTGKSKGKEIQPFTASFRSRDRAFAYIGIEAEEQGRLILYNLTQQQKTILTPPDLVVMDFEPYPDGEKILFSANDRHNEIKGLLTQQLYTITTGLSFTSSSSQGARKLELVLDSKEYQNLQFDLSPDGQTIVVQRVKRNNPAEFGLWILQPNTQPKPLGTPPGGNFLITGDSESLALLQGQGLAIVSLPTAKQIDFMPQFEQVLAFARDNSLGAMMKFNRDPKNPTRSLFLWKNNQSANKELLRTTGSIINCQFAPNQEKLYCLLTQVIKGETYREQPFIAALDLKTDRNSTEKPVQPLAILPEQQDIVMSLSPDGLALLFDQIVTKPASETDTLKINGQAIANARLWLLPLVDSTTANPPNQLQPEELLPGFHPRWLP